MKRLLFLLLIIGLFVPQAILRAEGICTGSAELVKPVLPGDVTWATNDTTDEDWPRYVWTIHTRQSANVFASITGTVFNIERSGAGYSLEIRSGDLPVIYNGLSSVYAKVGDEVGAGCIIGVSGLQVFQFQYSSVITDIPWTDWAESSSLTPCSAANNISDCLLNNPAFANNGEGWNAFDGAIFNTLDLHAYEAELPHNGTIAQMVKLTPSTEYQITISVTVTTGTMSNLEVFLGDAKSEQPVIIDFAGQYKKLTFALTPTVASFSPDLFVFTIINNFGPASTIRINFLCISAAPLELAPGTCYFEDPNHFTDDWTKSEGASWQPPRPGENGGDYVLAPGSDIRIPVHLKGFTDAVANYHVSINLVDFLAPAHIGDAGLDVSIVDSGDSTLKTIGTTEVNGFPFYSLNTIDLSLTSEEDYDGYLKISNPSGNAGTYYIGEVCITIDGGIWPGTTTITPTGGFDRNQCRDCPALDLLNIDPLRTLDHIGCLIMAVICWLDWGWNSILGASAKLLAAITGLGLWFSGVFQYLGLIFMGYLKALIPNLMALLITGLNQVLLWLIGLGIIQAILDFISLAGVWLLAIGALLGQALGLLVLALSQLATIILAIQVFIANLIAGINSPASTVFTLPNCGNPADTWYTACIMLETFDWFLTKMPEVGAFISFMVALVVYRIVEKEIFEVQEILSDL